jgi:hypothetical protein
LFGEQLLDRMTLHKTGGRAETRIDPGLVPWLGSAVVNRRRRMPRIGVQDPDKRVMRVALIRAELIRVAQPRERPLPRS